MPFKDKRDKRSWQRDYMREYMRASRKNNAYIRVLRPVGTNWGDSEDLNVKTLRPKKWGTEMYQRDQHMIDYMNYIGERGYRLERFIHPRDGMTASRLVYVGPVTHSPSHPVKLPSVPESWQETHSTE